MKSAYDALSHSPDRSSGNSVDLSIYRAREKPVYGTFEYEAPLRD